MPATLYQINGQKVTLLGWRSLTQTNLIVLTSLFIYAAAGIGVGFWKGGAWWLLFASALCLLAYAFWATIESTKVKLVFGDGSISINGIEITTSEESEFYMTVDKWIEGIEGKEGGKIIWLRRSDGQSDFITLMSIHANEADICTTLNNKLRQSAAPSHSSHKE